MLALAGFLVVVLTLITVFYGLFGAAMAESFFNGKDLNDLGGPVYAFSSLTAGVALLVFAYLYTVRYKRVWKIAFLSTLIPGSVVVLAPVVNVLLPVDVEINWYWLLFGLFPIAMLAWVGKQVGMTALLISRREIKSRNYIKMLRAKTAEGDAAIDDIYLEIVMMIRTGEIIPADLPGWAKQAIVALGIPGFSYSGSAAAD